MTRDDERLDIGDAPAEHPASIPSELPVLPLRASVTAAEDVVREEDRLEIDALQRNIKTNFQHVVSLSPLLSDDLQALAMNITEPGRLADFIASSLATLSTQVKQDVLETVDV